MSKAPTQKVTAKNSMTGPSPRASGFTARAPARGARPRVAPSQKWQMAEKRLVRL